MASDGSLTVFYDGSCPLCAREIAFYKRHAGAERIIWTDVSRADSDEVAPGLSKAHALARFHVMTKQGGLVSGGRASAQVWSHLPRFAWLARIFGSPLMGRLLDRAYQMSLVMRPWLSRITR